MPVTPPRIGVSVVPLGMNPAPVTVGFGLRLTVAISSARVRTSTLTPESP